MAYSSKVWKDRVSEYANRRKLIDSSSNESVVTVQRYEGQITQEGDAFNAANMNDLESRIANGLGEKQDVLVSGTTLKTLNDINLLGSGNIAVQPTLVSGTNIKSINGDSILNAGNLNLTKCYSNNITVRVLTTSEYDAISSKDVNTLYFVHAA